MPLGDEYKVRRNEQGQWEVNMLADNPMVCESREHAELMSEAHRMFFEEEPSQSSLRRVLEALQRRGMDFHNSLLYRRLQAKEKKEERW